MQEHVCADQQWGVHTIVTVMRGFLPTVFADMFPDSFRAKEFLGAILRVMKARTDRSHRLELMEADVLDAMHQMVRVLTVTGHRDSASNINSFLGEAKDMLAMCPDEGERFLPLKLSKDDCNAHLLCMALNAFEAHLEAEVSPFLWQWGTTHA